MESIFDHKVNRGILSRIEQLTPSYRSQWGKIEVSQMLTHCQQPLKVGSGELKLKRGFIGILFGGIARRKMASGDAPFWKNLPTDPNFIIR